MLLADVVATSRAVAATRSRKAKVSAVAELLGRLDDAGPEEVATVVSYLAGSLRQRRTGLGWRSLATLPPPAAEPSLTVTGVHEDFDAIAALAGPGSQAARTAAVETLFARATPAEQAWLRGLVTGEVRQGALDALVQEAVAVAGDVPLAAVRRAAMLAGSTVAVATAALTGGVEALAAYGLEVGRPVLPMLASAAPSTAEAMAKAGGGEVALDTKLDGIRIQVHRDGDDVLVATRSLDDITARLPEVVAVARSLPAERFVLDGEAIALDADGRPRPFQETASRTAQASDGRVAVTPYFFDLLHLDGRDLLDSPGAERLAELERLVPETHRVDRLVTADADAADAFVARVLAAGHEGVVVKNLAAPYDAGRRGAAWVKVKPVLTLDLVVLAVEWGSGRRHGKLSNIHLGARDPESGGFVMLGKTFKGMTDEMLAWQTERFLSLATSRDPYAVQVRPEQVVEVAIDGVQRSTRYPGGVALRFARVVRYRDDKLPVDVDTIDSVRSLLTGTTTTEEDA
ncbi:ATP-dependent DNA ligase [Nocardioides marmotae]|uniref:ATP-dependent DNA ligase n=1 Tax=Nocardioides marmotae TaxID=2663857 RepID=UPI001327F6B0|nr:ATP-dependent DNA ligase [Nocardioides marmotae]MBC9731897.1 ATP-dependent DNA ligase [Nocardioides marmotae]MTB83017.1 ATP-dependent DNA ligase [Nocardioides marmotae]